MSTILDALRKLQKEREGSLGPRTRPAPPPPRRRHGISWSMVALVALLALSGAAGALWVTSFLGGGADDSAAPNAPLEIAQREPLAADEPAAAARTTPPSAPATAPVADAASEDTASADEPASAGDEALVQAEEGLDRTEQELATIRAEMQADIEHEAEVALRAAAEQGRAELNVAAREVQTTPGPRAPQARASAPAPPVAEVEVSPAPPMPPAPAAQRTPAPAKPVAKRPEPAPTQTAPAKPVAKRPEPAPTQAAPVKPVAKPPEPAPTQPEPAAPRASAPVAQPMAAEELPKLVVTSVRWHPDPLRRVAQLQVATRSPQEVHEGDVIDGVQITRIDPAAVEVELGGARRLIRVGR